MANHVQDEERRKILKMLVTPQATKRTLSSVSFDSMVIKAARSADNVNSAGASAGAQISPHGLTGRHDNSIIRKESSSSLQIPGQLRRVNSDSVTKSEDSTGKKVVSFWHFWLLDGYFSCTFSVLFKEAKVYLALLYSLRPDYATSIGTPNQLFSIAAKRWR